MQYNVVHFLDVFQDVMFVQFLWIIDQIVSIASTQINALYGRFFVVTDWIVDDCANPL